MKRALRPSKPSRANAANPAEARLACGIKRQPIYKSLRSSRNAIRSFALKPARFRPARRSFSDSLLTARVNGLSFRKRQACRQHAVVRPRTNQQMVCGSVRRGAIVLRQKWEARNCRLSVRPFNFRGQSARANASGLHNFCGRSARTPMAVSSSRSQVATRLTTMPPCLIGTTAATKITFQQLASSHSSGVAANECPWTQ